MKIKSTTLVSNETETYCLRFSGIPRELEQQMRDTQRVFDDLERRVFGRGTGWLPTYYRSSTPSVTRDVPIVTKPDGTRLYRARFDLTEYEPENIKVALADRTVTIKARDEQKAEDGSVRRSQEYVYEYSLPAEVEPNNVKSYLKDGILNIEADLPAIEPPKSNVHELEIERKSNDKSLPDSNKKE